MVTTVLNLTLLGSPSLANSVNNEILCMAQTIYFEARGESLAGQLAVGLVTLNRVKDARFPKTVCEVVKQDCQYSWYCDGKTDKLPLNNSANIALILAKTLMTVPIPDFTNGALFFHSKAVNSKFTEKTIVIGNHIFYRRS